MGSKISGGKKTNKHKQLRGIVPEMGGGQIVYVFPFFPWKKGSEWCPVSFERFLETVARGFLTVGTKIIAGPAKIVSRN